MLAELTGERMSVCYLATVEPALLCLREKDTWEGGLRGSSLERGGDVVERHCVS